MGVGRVEESNSVRVTIRVPYRVPVRATKTVTTTDTIRVTTPVGFRVRAYRVYGSRVTIRV